MEPKKKGGNCIREVINMYVSTFHWIRTETHVEHLAYTGWGPGPGEQSGTATHR